MSHRFYEGEMYHKRLIPKVHEFTYPFFLLDIETRSFETLKTKYFSINGWNLFSFFTKDHFGVSNDFNQNISEIIKEFDLEIPAFTRFITLPRMFNFVFNPISILVLFNKEKVPKNMLVEVHNYNGGRVVYPVSLEHKSGTKYGGNVDKDMYVSPFLKRDGIYKFVVDYNEDHLNVSIALYEDKQKVLIAAFTSHSKEFSSKSILELFFHHIFLTFKVVTQTLWQSLKLYLKGIKFNSVTKQDTIRRH